MKGLRAHWLSGCQGSDAVPAASAVRTQSIVESDLMITGGSGGQFIRSGDSEIADFGR